MVGAFTITETKYLMISLFDDLVRSLSYLYMWYEYTTSFGCTICLVSGVVRKAIFIHNILVETNRAKLFSNKILFPNSVLKIVRFTILF